MKINIKKDYIVVLTVLFISRLLLFFLGYFGRGALTEAVLVQWDGVWYNKIMTQGYDNAMPAVEPDHYSCHEGTNACQRNFAFFPLYPIASKATADVLSIEYTYAALLISNTCFVLAGLLLYRLAKKIFGSKQVAFSSLLLFAFFPFSYIFSGVMTESLFIFLLLAGYSLALERKYLAAGFVGLLLSATRNTGILFMIPLFLVWLESKNHLNIKSLFRKLWRQKIVLLALALVPLGLLGFMYFLHNHVGDALAFIHIQKYWEKPLMGLNPLFGFFMSFISIYFEGSWLTHLMNLAVVAMMFFLFVYSYKKKVLKMSLNNILLWIIVPMTAGTLLAMGRYAAVAFPLYLILANFIDKHRIIRYLVYTLFLVFFLALGYFYYQGNWITV